MAKREIHTLFLLRTSIKSLLLWRETNDSAYSRTSSNDELSVSNLKLYFMNEVQIIQNRIYEIRGQRVMLDFDLAALYGIETRALNQAVKRNIDRFPEDFMFQLTKGEWELLKSQFVTAKTYVKENANNLPSHIVIANGIEKKRFQPYAFTENDERCVEIAESELSA